jgi:hypothetical protein
MAQATRMDNLFQTLAQASKGLLDNQHLVQDLRVRGIREANNQIVNPVGLSCSHKQHIILEQNPSIDIF